MSIRSEGPVGQLSRPVSPGNTVGDAEVARERTAAPSAVNARLDRARATVRLVLWGARAARLLGYGLPLTPTARLALAYTVLAESAGDPEAIGDAGRSVGALQFYDATATALQSAHIIPAGSGDWRTSPLVSGWAAQVYIGDASPEVRARLADADPSKLRETLAVWRVVWRYGVAGVTPGRVAAERAALRPTWLARAAEMSGYGPVPE